MGYEPDKNDNEILSIGDVTVYADKNFGIISIDQDDQYTHLTKSEAIAAAKAILKHYDIDFNAYEDNISERYRPLTKAEMDQHLKDNPNLVLVVIDPDAPLTSELAERFKEELK